MIVQYTKQGKIDKQAATELLKVILANGGTGGPGERHKDMAITGMAVKLPQADDLREFWQNIRHGMDCIGDYPAARQKDSTGFIRSFINDGDSPLQFHPGGYLNEIDKFDYKFFQISPNEASLMDPHQRLFLETAWAALEDAGYGGKQLSGSKTGVYLGYNSERTYGQFIAKNEPSAASISVTGNLPPVTAGRIAYILDFKGPCLLVDTACSSSSVAVHLACQAIRNGDCDQAIAGGVRISLTPAAGVHDNELGLVSKSLKTKAFDENSDGTVWGEGVAAIFIKPLSNALKDGDSIYAVIKGSAINQDGKSAGLTAPNSLAQAEVITQAWREAGIDPETISYIETHGTGTKLGDPIEVDGIQKSFRKYTSKKQICAIGSVKTNIGHLDSVAGVAGIIKAVLALKNREIPPSLHFEVPNRKINFLDSPVYVNNRLTPWLTNGFPRRCGVSSFGFSGTNCHFVLEEAPEHDEAPNITATGEIGVLAVTAKSETGLKGLIARYLAFLQSNPRVNLKDFCYTINTGRGHYPYRLWVTFHDYPDLIAKLTVIDFPAKAKESFGKGFFYGELKPAHRGAGDRKAGEPETNQIKELTRLANEKLKAWVAANFSDQILPDQIGELYTSGADLDWEELYRGEKRRRVHAPGYPFERSRCWLDSVIASVNCPAEQITSGPVPAFSKVPVVAISGRIDAAYSTWEKELAQLWGEVLGLLEININDSFYELGGDSIIAVRIVNMLNQRTGTGIQVADLLKNSTVSQLAEFIAGASPANHVVINPAEEREYYPVSSSQKRTYIAAQHQGAGTSYNIPNVILIDGTVNIDRLKKVFRILVHRHEAFRTTFGIVGAELVQKVQPDMDFEIEYSKLAVDTDGNKVDQYEQRIKEKVQAFIRPFDLSKAPLLRAGLVEISPNKYVLMYDMHHIISDGTSLNILAGEFTALYRGEELPALRIQYKDYAIWQNDFLNSDLSKKQEEFWLGQFAGEIPLLDLPADYPRSSVRSYEGDNITVCLDREYLDKLSKLALETGTTLFMLLLAAYNLLLAKHTGREDIIVGTNVAGRPHADLENVIGMFTNTLALRNYPRAERTFRDFLAEVKQNALNAYQNQDYPYEKMLEKLGLQRDPGRNPLFDTVLTIQEAQRDDQDIHRDFEITPYEFDRKVARLDLLLMITEIPAGLHMNWEYSSRLFYRERIARMQKQLIMILDQILENPDLKLGEISITRDLFAANSSVLTLDSGNFEF